jgi:hypothetical protein
MNIVLHIERLVLDGLPITRQQAPRIQAAIEIELTRLLSEDGLAGSLQSGGALPSVRANAIQIAFDHSPTNIGNQIAHSIYGGIGNAR